MAKFGTQRYASGIKYGEVSTVSVYYNSGLTAWSQNYATIQLNWQPITPNPLDPTPTHWILVKGYSGSLDNPLNAIKLAGGPYGSFTTSYTDTISSPLDVEVSYSLWVFNGIRWIKCGDDSTLVVSNKDSLTNVSSWFPRAWVNNNVQVGDAVGEVDSSNPFVNILDAFTFMYDKFRVEAALLMLNNDARYTPNALLDFKGPSYGMTYEDALGDSYNRSLSAGGFVINKYKGSVAGLGIYTTALTHWQNSYVPGHNLMLDYNDSSFEESIGRWAVSSGTFVRTAYAGSGLSAPSTNVLYDATYTPRVVGFGKLTTTATTAVTMTLPGGSTNSPILYGIPITGNTRYVFSGWVYYLNNSATVTAKISWYDIYGNLISTTAAGTTLTTTASWSEFTSKSDSGRNGQLAPINAYYATVALTVTPSSSSSSSYAFDFFQFAEYHTSFEYEDARKTTLVVVGDKENYITNPDFELGTYNWTAINGSLLADSSKTAAVVHGSRSCKLTSTVDGLAAYVTDWFPVDPDKTMTFSAYVMGSAAENAILRVEFTNLSSIEQQSSILHDTYGAYYPTNEYYVESTPVTLSTTATKQISVTTITSPYTEDTGNPVCKVSIYFPNATAGNQFWIDGILAEEAFTPSAYYGGNGGVFPTDPTTQPFYSTSDCFWEIKTLYNHLHNPSFELTATDWTATTGTLTVLTVDGAYTPLYGTHFGKLTYTTTGTLTTTAYLPWAAVGGEDYTVSAFVNGAVGTYTINGATYTIPSTEAANWVCISSTQILTTGQTTVPISISVTNTSGSTSTFFHIDGVQGSYGRLVGAFVDPAASTTKVLINPLNTAKNLYGAKIQSPYGGKSSYFNNSAVKLSRLKNTLSNFLPLGTSWRINTGDPSDQFADIPNSLFPASSFEVDLGTWVTNNSTLARKVAGGTLLGDPVSHGQAYGIVTTAGSSGSRQFGVKTNKIYLQPTGGYYCSVAIRPQNSNSLGNYTLEVDWYDANNNAIVIYTDNITGLITTAAYDQTGTANTVNSSGRQTTTSITQLNRWAYIANTFPVSSITGAAYAIINVTFNPSSYISGQAFAVDRVVFRQ